MKNVLLALALISASAQAADQQSINFEQLKAACKNPAQFQNQNKPSSMKLDCADHILFWRVVGNGVYTAPATRLIAYRVSSDKYGVPSTKGSVRHPGQDVACPQLQQFASDVAVTEEITCDTIENYEGTAIDKCKSILDDMRKNNAKVIEDEIKPVKDATVSLCSPKAPEPVAPMPKPPVQKPTVPAKPSKPSKPSEGK